MDHSIKMKLLEQLLESMASSQGSDLKSRLMKKEMGESPEMEAMESPEEQALEDAVGAEMHGKPKGISVEKVSVMGKPGFDEQAEEAMEEAVPDKGMDEELTDEEIAELLKQLG